MIQECTKPINGAIIVDSVNKRREKGDRVAIRSGSTIWEINVQTIVETRLDNQSVNKVTPRHTVRPKKKATSAQKVASIATIWATQWICKCQLKVHVTCTPAGHDGQIELLFMSSIEGTVLSRPEKMLILSYLHGLLQTEISRTTTGWQGFRVVACPREHLATEYPWLIVRRE